MVEEKRKERKLKRESTDLREYMDSFPWALRESGIDIGGPNNLTILFNMTFFIGSKYDIGHQGDINLEMIGGIRERMESLKDEEKIYLFSEHNPEKPICGPFDGTSLPFNKGMARPFGKEDIPLDRADIILEQNGDATINYTFWKPESTGKYLEDAGWNVEYMKKEDRNSGPRVFYW
jgi:hypothetical protein